MTTLRAYSGKLPGSYIVHALLYSLFTYNPGHWDGWGFIGEAGNMPYSRALPPKRRIIVVKSYPVYYIDFGESVREWRVAQGGDRGDGRSGKAGFLLEMQRPAVITRSSRALQYYHNVRKSIETVVFCLIGWELEHKHNYDMLTKPNTVCTPVHYCYSLGSHSFSFSLADHRVTLSFPSSKSTLSQLFNEKMYK